MKKTKKRRAIFRRTTFADDPDRKVRKMAVYRRTLMVLLASVSLGIITVLLEPLWSVASAPSAELIDEKDLEEIIAYTNGDIWNDQEAKNYIATLKDKRLRSNIKKDALLKKLERIELISIRRRVIEYVEENKGNAFDRQDALRAKVNLARELHFDTARRILNKVQLDQLKTWLDKKYPNHPNYRDDMRK